jgi:hypothetical protein
LKRSVTDVLRRGLLSTLANWPVILTRVAETLVLAGVVIVAIIGCIVPLLVSAGIKEWTLPEARNPWEIMWAIVAEHAGLFTYLFLFTLFIVGVMMAIHAFVMAGAARIYVDADRAVPDAPEPGRERFAVFTLERWTEGARAAWWRIFWIYNGAWAMYGLILLVPVALVGLLTTMAALSDNIAATVAASCGGLLLLALIAVPLGFVVAIWAQKAIIVCVARDVPAREALRSGWRESRADFLRHFVIFFLITIISFGAAAMTSTLAPLSFSTRHQDLWAILTGPVQIVAGAAQSAIASAIGCWLIAAFAALNDEERTTKNEERYRH